MDPSPTRHNRSSEFGPRLTVIPPTSTEGAVSQDGALIENFMWFGCNNEHYDRVLDWSRGISASADCTLRQDQPFKQKRPSRPKA